MLLVLFLIANCSLTVSLGMGLFSWLSDHRRLLMAPEEVDLADISENPYANTVILVCIDGFRPDYIESGHIPMLEYLASLGYMGKMRSQFPSYTFPNHFSMVTGVHPEIHGIVNNRFHDRYLNATFSYKDLSRKDPKWWNYEPIWNTIQNSKNNLRSAVSSWPGSEVPILGKLPTYYFPYDNSVSSSDKFNQCLEWLDMESSIRPSLLTAYLGNIDSAAHSFGTTHPQLIEALKEVNEGFEVLVKGLEQRGLLSKIHIVVVSDHGMSDIQAQKILYLSDHVDISLIKFIHDGPFTTIDLLRPSLDESDFYKKLKGMARRTRGFQVYFKNNLPEKYRNYHNNHRVSDFLLVAEIGFSISLERDDSVFLPLASHGYWPHEPSMKSFFLATGPLLLNFSMNKENSILKKSSKEIRNEFSNLDVYPFLNHLLGCTGLPGNYSDFLIRELIR